MQINLHSQDGCNSYAFVGEKQKGYMSVPEILKYDGISVFHCDYDKSDFEVQRFSISYVLNGPDIEAVSLSSSFTDLQREYLRRCPAGAMVYFMNISIQPQNEDTILYVDDFSIKITAPASYGIINSLKSESEKDVNSIENKDILVIDDLLCLDSLIVKKRYANYDSTKVLKVKSFSMKTTPRSVYLVSENNRLTDEMKQSLKSFMTDELTKIHDIVFYNIRYETEEGEEYYASSLQIKVLCVNRESYYDDLPSNLDYPGYKFRFF